MRQIRGWTVSVENGCGRMQKDGKIIEFAGNLQFKKFSATQVVDMRGIYHDGRDACDVTLDAFAAAADEIHNKLRNGAVAVHCSNGRSRTSFALIAYLMRHDKQTYTEASEIVLEAQRERKTEVNLNARNTLGNGYGPWMESQEGSSRVKNLDDKQAERIKGGHVRPNMRREDSHRRISLIMSNTADSLSSTKTRLRDGPPEEEPRVAGIKRSRSDRSESSRSTKRRRTTDEITVEEGLAWVARWQPPSEYR